jgi:DNA-binding PadR family transcriptional regulator
LLPLEVAILIAGLDLRDDEFHGYAIASTIQEQEAARRLTAHGTLYRALARMEAGGLLKSRWEDADVAAAEGRPRRRLYRVTGLGETALMRARTQSADPVRGSRRAAPRLAAS